MIEPMMLTRPAVDLFKYADEVDDWKNLWAGGIYWGARFRASLKLADLIAIPKAWLPRCPTDPEPSFLLYGQAPVGEVELQFWNNHDPALTIARKSPREIACDVTEPLRAAEARFGESYFRVVEERAVDAIMADAIMACGSAATTEPGSAALDPSARYRG